MAHIHIALNGETFICPTKWTVDVALEEIRSRYGIQFGGLVCEDGTALCRTDLITAAVGAISFSGGRLIHQGVTLI